MQRGSCSSGARAPRSRPPSRASRSPRPPPAFALRDLSGREWKSAEIYAKGATAVVFWATWSPRSAEVIRDLEALRAKIGPEKIAVVTVNCHPAITAADREAIAAAAKQIGFTGPALLDDGLVAFNDYGAMARPSTLVVGAASSRARVSGSSVEGSNWLRSTTL